MSGAPYPKEQQLARGERRYRRKVASPKRWQAIIAAKRGPCRCFSWCDGMPVEYHHLVSRQAGGDDVADNIVPVCAAHHALLTRRSPHEARKLLSSLTDAEYAYMIEHGGEDYPERAYGVRYGR